MRIMPRWKSLNPSNKSDYNKMASVEEELWGRAKSATRLSWFDSPMLARCINRRISGSPDLDWLDYVKDKFFKKPVKSALNVGCGHGELERLILGRDITERMDGFDISPGAVEIASKLAEENGLGGKVRYAVADANFLDQADLDPQYNAVFVSMALHHFVHLEKCLDGLKNRLEPGGLFIANEFIGPDRFQWSDAQLSAANRLLGCFPAEFKVNLRNPEQNIDRIVRPSLKFMKQEMAFEAVCSERIIPALRDRFEIIEQRDYGGTVLQLLFEAIMGNFDEESSREHAIMVQMAAACEDLLLENGSLPHDHSLIICRKN